MNPWLGYAAIAVLSYALGSVNFAMVVGRLKGIDFRKYGTGNFGTANVLRVTGSIPWALFTLAGDAGKGIASVLISRAVASYAGLDADMASLMAAFFAILGHNHSFLLGFKSGRGIATFLGLSLAINPLIGMLWLVNWVPGYLVTGIISVGQITSTIYTPLMAFLMEKAGYIPARDFWFALLSCFLILEAHLEKIKAIRSGEEPRNYISIRKKKRVRY